MIALAIVCAEILFWVFLLSGLFARYALRQTTLGLVLLALTPVVDIVLIALTYIDLHRGADASFFHGLATVYVGFTVMFGPAIVRAMDAKFLRRYGGGKGSGAETARPMSSSGSPTEKDARRDWLKACAACGIAGVLIVIAMAIVGLARAYEIDMDPYLTETGKYFADEMEDASIIDGFGRLAGMSWDDLVKPEYPASIVVAWPFITRYLERRQARDPKRRREEFAPE